MTYWITASITLLTVQQLKITWLFIVSTIFYIGFSIFFMGRIFYWETHSSYLMGLVRYEVLSDGNEYTTLDLLQYTLDLKIRKAILNILIQCADDLVNYSLE